MLVVVGFRWPKEEIRLVSFLSRKLGKNGYNHV